MGKQAHQAAEPGETQHAQAGFALAQALLALLGAVTPGNAPGLIVAGTTQQVTPQMTQHQGLSG